MGSESVAKTSVHDFLHFFRFGPKVSRNHNFVKENDKENETFQKCIFGDQWLVGYFVCSRDWVAIQGALGQARQGQSYPKRTGPGLLSQARLAQARAIHGTWHEGCYPRRLCWRQLVALDRNRGTLEKVRLG